MGTGARHVVQHDCMMGTGVHHVVQHDCMMGVISSHLVSSDPLKRPVFLVTLRADKSTIFVMGPHFQYWKGSHIEIFIKLLLLPYF